MGVKEEQRRLVALDYPGSEVPDVSQYKDELVVFDGLIRFFSNDSGEAIRDKIAAKLQQKKPSFVDLKTCGPDDFDFVKVENKRIHLPDGHEEFDSRTISGIYKQGAIYVRLNRSFTIFQVSTQGLFIGRRCNQSASVTLALTSFLFFGRVYGMVTKDLSKHKNSNVKGDEIRFARTKGEGLEA